MSGPSTPPQPPANDPRPKIKRITVTVEMEDGRTSVTESRENAIDQIEGVRITRDRQLADTVLSNYQHNIERTTVTWVERWVEW